MMFHLSELKPIPKKFFKGVVPIGKPNHLAGKHNGWSVCGKNGVTIAKSFELVNCLSCMRTKHYKIQRLKD